MKVFVTGGTGFVGVHVVAALQQRGHAVTCLLRDAQKAARVFGTHAPALVPGDLGDAPALARGCAAADAVVHLAGLTAARSRAELFAVNVGGVQAMADAVRASGADVRRFVHVSSLAAAGPVTGGVEPSGREAARPVSDYGRSKLAGEEPVRRLSLAWTILRPPAVYGPHDREFLRLFRVAARGLRIGGRVVAPVFGDGSQRLSVVFAADLAEAIARCLESDPAPGIYYPAHRTVTTSRALVEGIATAVGARLHVVGIPRGLVRPLFWLTGNAARLAGRATLLSADKANEILADAWTCSPTALEQATGWQASTELAAGLRRTGEWYRAAGWL